MYDTARIVGVDLGQQRDPTAIAVLDRGYAPNGKLYNATYTAKGREHYGAREPVRREYSVRHLERPALGTSYVDVADRIIELLKSLPDDEIVLAVDITGVGRPVGDMLRERLNEWLEVDRSIVLHGVWITITGGDCITRAGDGGGIRVPKRDIAKAAVVLMEAGQLKIAENLPLTPVLKRELANFKVKINLHTGHDSYEAWREGDHDDLVLAVAMATWAGERYFSKQNSLPRPGRWADEGVPTHVARPIRPVS